MDEGRIERTLIQSAREPSRLEGGFTTLGDGGAFKGMLYGDVAAILLAKQSPDNGGGLFAKCVPGDVVGDGQEDQRVQDGLEARLGGGLQRQERVRLVRGRRHDEPRHACGARCEKWFGGSGVGRRRAAAKGEGEGRWAWWARQR